MEVYDPWVNPEDAVAEYGITLSNELEEDRYDVIVFAAAHKEFEAMGIEQIKRLGKSKHV